jgi:uncharacterized protein YbjQ (UPF0145 family)
MTKKKDITRIEDLSEFLHENSSEVPDFSLTPEEEPLDFSKETEEASFSEDSSDHFSEDFAENFSDTFPEDGAQDDHSITFDDPSPFPEETLTEAKEEQEKIEEEIEEEIKNEDFPPLVDTFSPPPLHVPPLADLKEDLKVQQEHLSFTATPQRENNPSFALIIREIATQDRQAIKDLVISILEGQVPSLSALEQGLDLGTLFISQISKYASILLAHKVREYTDNITWGPSEVLLPHSQVKLSFRGIMGEAELKNQKQQQQITPVKERDILYITHASDIDGQKIEQYLGVVSAECYANALEIHQLGHRDSPLMKQLQDQAKQWLANALVHVAIHSEKMAEDPHLFHVRAQASAAICSPKV